MRAYGAFVISMIIAASAVPQAAAEEARYDAKGRRDPFISLFSADRVTAIGLDNVNSASDLKLEGIATAARGRSVAFINGELVKEGDRFGTLEIKKVKKDSVVVSFGGTDYTLNLKEK